MQDLKGFDSGHYAAREEGLWAGPADSAEDARKTAVACQEAARRFGMTVPTYSVVYLDGAGNLHHIETVEAGT